MAARLMAGSPRIVAYLPSLRATVRHFRAFSSSSSNVGHSVVYAPNSDPRFPLPGQSAPAVAPGNVPHGSRPTGVYRGTETDLLSVQLPIDRHVQVMAQIGQRSASETAAQEEATSAQTCPLECVAQQCPQTLKKEFQDLFPNRDLSQGDLTIIAISQKTSNDMTGWNAEVEAEREELLDTFMTGAQEICQSLQDAGYWADFIDPSSGRPYFGEYTNSTMWETDDRYRYLGFEIEDMGCCKVISHHMWGTHAYVGCLFTDAPLDNPLLKNLNSAQTPTP